MLTLSSLLDRTIRLWGDRAAIVDEDRTLTWRQFGARIAKTAAVLADLGIARGDRFAVLGYNASKQAEILQAGYHLGAVPVPVNYRLASQEILAILDDSDASLFMVQSCLAALLDSRELRAWKSRTVQWGSHLDGSYGTAFDRRVDCASPVPAAEAQPEDDALLLYTGGTTGRSKGVRLTHCNLATNALQIAAMLNPREDDVYLHVAPMFHAADMLGNAYTANGAAHRYMARPTARAILEAVSNGGISATMMPPTLIILALQDPVFGTFNLSSLRTLVFGSAPMPPRWILAAREALAQAELWHGYGLTETSPILTLTTVPRITAATLPAVRNRLRSAGRPVIGTELRIVGDDNLERPVGEAGEVVVRGPQIARGYLNRPEETAEQFRGRWFRTGDVGSVDSEGYLYLLDRKKDMVITGGENVYTLEVESVLNLHPDIAEAAVIGVPDDAFGEALVALVVCKAGKTLTDQEIIEHCRTRIGGYKIPRRIQLVDSLPKNAVGKIIKAELRRQYGS